MQSNQYYYMKKIVSELHENYLNPIDWLETPNHEKDVITHRTYYDTNYIACWAWENKLYLDQQYSLTLFDYFMNQPKNLYSKTPLWLSKRLNLLTDEELTALATYKRGMWKFAALHCLFTMKPFKEFTDGDIKKIVSMINNRVYTAKAIQNVRINLGYSNVIVKRKAKKGTWDKLIEHPIHGSMFNDYYDFLVRSQARKGYLSAMGTVLRKLMQYLEAQELDDCSNFSYEDFIKYTEHLREQVATQSALLEIYKLRKFLQWGAGEHPFFPSTLDLPNQYWNGLMRSVKAARKETDGRAFSDIDLPQHIVDIVYNCDPENEIEDLCRSFWLIIASCPARFSYILNLSADDALQELPNVSNAFGIYSKLADKAGNKYGHFPILDDIGHESIEYLQSRAKRLELKPLKNPDNKKTYVHLFQLQQSPWLIDRNMIIAFFDKYVKPRLYEIYPDFDKMQATAHGFRHYLLTEVALATGDIESVQTAAGHRDDQMTREYLRSKVSRTALLHRVMDKYESKELTGKFYLRLVELLSSSETPVDEMLRALTTDMQMDEFLQRYGRKTVMGYCFDSSGCANWLKCWSCTNFLITRNEITDAIKTLSHQIISLKEMQKNTYDFSYNHPIVEKQLTVISHIIKRLTELDLTEEQITKMVDNYLHHKQIEEGVIHNAS